MYAGRASPTIKERSGRPESCSGTEGHARCAVHGNMIGKVENISTQTVRRIVIRLRYGIKGGVTAGQPLQVRLPG